MSVSESGVRPILAGAVDLARRALLELQPTGVGEHLGVTGENECAATHHFAATLPGYRGWQWEVVVAAAPDAEYATVSESALLPGPDALVAPDFVPWDQRIRPGDLAPGDLLAPRVDDPRLVPGYLETGDPVVDEVCEEIGLGRRQVLSREGRVEAAERWYSEFGPDTEMARSAPGTCGVCGFFVPLAGALRAAFGVCANAMGADGRVVHVEYGCGAHSDTEMPTGAGSPLYEAYDDAAIEVVPAEELTARDGAGEAETTADAPAGADTPAASEAAVRDASVDEGAAAGESPSSPGETAAEVSSADVDATRVRAADAAPETPATEELSSAVGDASEPAEPGSASAAAADPGTAEGAPADSAGITSPHLAAAPSAETVSTPATSVAGGAESGAAATGGDADGSANAEIHSATADAADTDAESASESESAAPDAAGAPAAAETDRSTAESAAGAEPVRYSDAWAVSAVRVQPGESGAAEEN